MNTDNFDPQLDWPPDGAVVVTQQGTATFCEEPIVGWHFDDGRYARPFDSLGQMLARAWARSQQIAEREQGLLHKYDVRRVNDPSGKHDDCRYFVLDPQHDALATYALAAYAKLAAANGYEALAADLDAWLEGL